MTGWLLPLFPLNVVLFPGIELPLHIFEERYKEMISECISGKSEFGVVLLQQRSLENTGCAAYVADVIKRYEDGRMDIVTRGSRRFEIISLNQEKEYLRGEPQFFDDEPSPPVNDSTRMEAIRLYEAAKSILRLDEADLSQGSRHEQLSYQIAGRLPLDLAFKQSLLPLRSEAERLASVISYLTKLIENVTKAAKARAKAGLNGHGR